MDELVRRDPRPRPRHRVRLLRRVPERDDVRHNVALGESEDIRGAFGVVHRRRAAGYAFSPRGKHQILRRPTRVERPAEDRKRRAHHAEFRNQDENGSDLAGADVRRRVTTRRKPVFLGLVANEDEAYWFGWSSFYPATEVWSP